MSGTTETRAVGYEQAMDALQLGAPADLDGICEWLGVTDGDFSAPGERAAWESGVVDALMEFAWHGLERSRNEDRADWGEAAVRAACQAWGADWDRLEDRGTALLDTLADLAHLADRLGIEPGYVFGLALDAYQGDAEDGPRARPALDPGTGWRD